MSDHEDEQRAYSIKSNLNTSEDKTSELFDLVSLIFGAIDEINLEEKSALINGIIHECNRMLCLYDPMRESPSFVSGSIPIDSPAFYNVYGQALYHLWFENYENYLDMSETYLKISQQSKDPYLICKAYTKIKNAKENLWDILKMALIQYKNAFKWSKKPSNLVFMPKFDLSNDNDETNEDLELLEACADKNNIRAELTRCYLISLVIIS